MKDVKEENTQPVEECVNEGTASATTEETCNEPAAENSTEPVGEPTTEEAAEAPQEESAAEDNTTEEEKLLLALADSQAKYDELHDKYLRQVAEFENYRKRTLKEKSELILNGSANLMTAVLPVLDDMDRALDSMAKTDDAVACCEGFKLIAAKFRSTLEQNGMKQIETKDKAFDTDFHEAVALMPAADESQKNMILDCVQAGYMLNDKVLRHAKVVVCN